VSTALTVSIVTSLIQVVVVGVGGLILVGLMAKIKARAEGRVGSPIVQPLRDVRKLVTKERLHAHHSSAVLPLAPIVLTASAAVAIAISPLIGTHPLLGVTADIFVIVYLLLTGSVASALAGLDTATAFGGMGSSRAMTIGALAEPALLVAVIALSIQAGTSNLPGIVAGTLHHPAWAFGPVHLFALGAFLIVVIAETGRIPVDNPSTHLELTMVHEAMVLEYAGPELALVTVGEAMRLGLLVALVASLFLPWGVASGSGLVGLVVATLALALKMAVVAGAVALIEVRSAKLRLFRLPELLAGGFVLAVLAVVMGLVSR
jgi:formate hydrogenlyase subunit 4